VESRSVGLAFDDTPASLLEAAKNETYKKFVEEKLGAEKYKEAILALEKLVEKERLEGNFQSVEDGVLFKRTPEEVGTAELGEGFNTSAGIRGGKLSGGQKQRIAIARAIIREPMILLLDEATSALDEDSQKKVQLALDNVMSNRTSIVVAHRLTTIEKCRRVVVIQNGKVVQQGTFDNLNTDKSGYFAKLTAGMKQGKN